MPEIRQSGPISYEVSAAVSRGQLVMPDGTTGKVKPATAGAVTVLGVARDDADPSGTGTNLDFGTLRTRTAVYGAPYEVEVTASADILFGQRVVAAANGQVAPVAAADFAASYSAADANTQSSIARAVIGYCTSPDGITSGDKGPIKLI